MADKLSWTELRRAIATRADITEKQAATFLSAFQAQLIDALKKDKLVKINGLGTFKLQAVAPRKSVDVTTGEEITIEGYNKVVFVPEAGVKELVEKAGEIGETAEALHLTESKEDADPIKKLGAQAEEIVDILGELGQAPQEEEKKEETKTEKIEPMKEEPKETEQPKEPEATFVIEEKPYVPYVPEEKPKRYHFLRDTLICVVILLLLLLIGYFFFRQQISGWFEQLMQPKPEPEVVEVVQEPVAEPVVEEEIAEWHYDQLLLTERLTPGSRLAWLAKKHYGDRDLWPYIYMANKDRLTNPSDVLVGTPIRVPKLTEADRDKSSAQFQRIKAEAEAAIHE